MCINIDCKTKCLDSCCVGRQFRRWDSGGLWDSDGPHGDLGHRLSKNVLQQI